MKKEKKAECTEFVIGGDYWFESREPENAKKEFVGRWIVPFNLEKKTKKLCRKAIENKVCSACSCTDLEELRFIEQLSNKNARPHGVACFYLEEDGIETLKKVLGFIYWNEMLEMKNHQLENICFEYTNQDKKIMLFDIVNPSGADFADYYSC